MPLKLKLKVKGKGAKDAAKKGKGSLCGPKSVKEAAEKAVKVAAGKGEVVAGGAGGTGGGSSEAAAALRSSTWTPYEDDRLKKAVAKIGAKVSYVEACAHLRIWIASH